MSKTFDFVGRSRAAGIHLGISVLVGLLVAALVFGLWFPGPYRLLSGGQSLFLLLIVVDLVLGPMLTFVAFNTSKTRTHLARDLSVVALLQLSGLVYGIHTVFLVRPVAIVFEANRFRAVSEVDVVQEELPQAPADLRRLSLTGPVLMGTRKPKDNDEKINSVQLALAGFDIATRPSFWQAYKESADRVLLAGKPLQTLLSQYPDKKQDIEAEIAKTGRTASDLKFLPVIGKKAGGSVLVDANTAEIVGILPYDGFF